MKNSEWANYSVDVFFFFKYLGFRVDIIICKCSVLWKLFFVGEGDKILLRFPVETAESACFSNRLPDNM